MTSPIHTTSAPTQITISPPPPASNSGGFFGGEGGGPGIQDIVDVINPLQHIPFASTLYREVSGDSISAAATLIGGTLFGGVFGFLGSLASVIFEQETGHSVGGAVVAALRGDIPDPNIQLASNEVNLGDFSGDVKRNICRRDCAVNEIAVAEATPAPAIEEKIAQAAAADELQTAAADITALAIPVIPPTPQPLDFKQREKDRQVLSLFGTPAAAVSKAYQKADMRAYLESASTNLVM